MLQKSGKIKVGHFFLTVIPCIGPVAEVSLRHWSTSTPHFLIEYVMAVRMILSLLKLVPNSIKYSIHCKNITLYQIDITFKWEKEILFWIKRLKVITAKCVCCTDAKILLAIKQINYLLIEVLFLHTCSCKSIIVINLKSTISMLEQIEKHTQI